MTLPELHPDELLSREASSTLTPREWADLSAHLERCPACALERAVRRQAARARVPSNQDHAIAARVVAQLLAGQAERKQGRLGAPVKWGGTWGRRVAYGALVLVLVSGTAMAGVALVTQIRQREAVPRPSGSDRVRSARPAPKRHFATGAASAPIEREPAEPAAAGFEPAPELAPEPAVAPAIAASAELAPGKAGAGHPRLNGARSERRGERAAPGAGRRGAPGEAPAARPGGDATALLGDAEAAESSGRPAEASRLYGELGRRFPGTREEVVARALHGQLLLDRLSNPGRALASFESYLSAQPMGTLAEEARLGRARSFERLGRSSEERAAWLELLRVHPRSVHASAARARLAALDRP